MNILDVVHQLRLTLPSLSEDFVDRFSISTVSVSNGLCTVTTVDPHRLRVGELASLSGVAIETPIFSVTKTGLTATVTTSSDHDLTEGFPELEPELAGFTSAAFNGKIEALTVANRRAFTFQTVEPTPTLNGNEVLLERQRIGGVNGLHIITAIGKNTFAFETTAADGNYEAEGATVSGSARVMACATPDRARAIYDEVRDALDSKAIAFVISDGGATSKDRQSESDAIAARTTGDDLRLKVVNDFTVAVYLPTEKQLAAELALGRFTGSILKAIVSSLFGLKLPSPFVCGGEYKAIFSAHELLDYDGATMVWGYSFQVPADLTIDDAVIEFGSRAFRDLDITVEVGNAALTVLDVDLDDEPLQ